MFKHILLPIDGSALAMKGARAGVRLAKALEARVSAAYVIPPYTPPMYGEGAMYIPSVEPQEYRRITEKQAGKALAAVEAEARAAGVRCKSLFLTDSQPFKGILRAARSQKCDAIDGKHFYIENGEIETFFADQIKSLIRVARRPDDEPFFRKDSLK